MDRLLEEVPKEYHKAFGAIYKLVDEFCVEHLNEGYRELAGDMTVSVCQEGSPVIRGAAKSWASGIVHALGMVNFLSDSSFEPYMSSSDLAKGFGVSQGTMTAKSKIIRDGLDIIPMDPNWCLPEMLGNNPLVWMVEVDGIVMDLRNAPRKIQELAYAEGLIPYIPEKADELPCETEDEVENIKFPGGKIETPEMDDEEDDDQLMLF